MRYIRTKDGIIVDTTKYKTVVERTFNGKVVAIDLNHWGQDNEKYITWIDAENIIKQADTIEELCDLYVIWLKNRELPIIERIQKGVRLHRSYFEIGECSFDKGYGAIWTDKGLIYVAKMNDKGELELL